MKMAVIGGGTMGNGIAHVFAQHGHGSLHVLLADIDVGVAAWPQPGFGVVQLGDRRAFQQQEGNALVLQQIGQAAGGGIQQQLLGSLRPGHCRQLLLDRFRNPVDASCANLPQQQRTDAVPTNVLQQNVIAVNGEIDRRARDGVGQAAP